MNNGLHAQYIAIDANDFLLNVLKHKSKASPSTHLDLSMRQLLAIDDLEIQFEQIQPNQPPLTHLDLSQNLLIKLNRNLFATNKFKYITCLNLARNQLVTLHQNSFDSLVSITHLDLSYNYIGLENEDSTHVSMFNGLHGLFKTNTKLLVLNLAHNCMKRLSVNAFENLTLLEQLNLSSNELVDLNYQINDLDEKEEKEEEEEEEEQEVVYEMEEIMDSKDYNVSSTNLKCFDDVAPSTSKAANSIISNENFKSKKFNFSNLLYAYIQLPFLSYNRKRSSLKSL